MITTHVLDTAAGRPGRAIAIELEFERRSREDQDDRREREALERRSREDQDDRREREALERDDGGWCSVGAGTTDDDGRLRTLTPPGPVAPGRYRLRFHTGAYFAAHGQTGFFPVVEIQFMVVDGAQHYHVPLLLSPYGYSTYRGS
jgi:5-hydroxyisourate hydrolase